MISCTKCKSIKLPSAFWNDKRRRSGLTAWCKACKSSHQKELRKKDIDKHRAREKRRYWDNKTSEQERHLVRKYGITFDDYDRMLSEQGGSCAICGLPEPTNKKLDVDHCHETGQVRGLLCTSCNRMLGHSGDRESVLIAAAEYLRSSRKSRRRS